MNELITSINDAVWGYVLIFALVGCGIWFTIKTRFVQFRMVGEMLRLLTDSAVDTVGEQVKEQQAGGKSKHISSFQAFAVSVATRVGTGNLAGVASAIAIATLEPLEALGRLSPLSSILSTRPTYIPLSFINVAPFSIIPDIISTPAIAGLLLRNTNFGMMRMLDGRTIDCSLSFF